MITNISETKTIEQLMDTPYFSSQRDRAICDSGGFYCEACLVGRPASEQSPDPRYCQGCYDYLMKEAEMIDVARRPSWIPRIPHPKPSETRCNKKIAIPKSECVESVMVHSKSPIIQAYQNPTEERLKPSVVGRPRKEVPTRLVHELSDKGLSIGGIVKELKTQGITLSAMTIQRCLARQTIKGKT